MAVDRKRKAGLLGLTGSQQFRAMRRVSESLAGRVGIVYRMGLSRRALIDDAQSHHPFIPPSRWRSHLRLA
jgi:hypothetical protein